MNMNCPICNAELTKNDTGFSHYDPYHLDHQYRYSQDYGSESLHFRNSKLGIYSAPGLTKFWINRILVLEVKTKIPILEAMEQLEKIALLL